MKSDSKYPHIINQLFKDFDEASNIRIRYKGYPCAPDDPDVTDFVILSVNGFKTNKEFKDYLYYLGTNLIHGIMKATETISPENKIIFFEEVLSRFKPLKTVVLFEKFYPKISEWDSKQPTGQFNFNRPELEGDIYHEAPYFLFSNIINASEKFAITWKKAIDFFFFKLSSISTMIEFIPYHSVAVLPDDPPGKIAVRLNVKQLAALIYFLIERRFFETNNKSEICRNFAKFLQTKGQDNISAGSLKNHLDSLDPDAILYWQEEFGHLFKNAQSLLKKYPM